MRARLMAIGVVAVALLILGLEVCGGDRDTPTTTTAVPPTTAPPPIAASTTTPPSTTPATTAPPTTVPPTTAPEPDLPDKCLLIDDARGVLVRLSADGEETDVGQILDAATDEPPRGGARNTPSQLEALAEDPTTGDYYATSWGLLGRLDPETAAFDEVGDTGLGDVDGLAFDADGILFAVSRVADAPDRLAVIDPEDGHAHDVGPIDGPGVLEDVDDLAFEPGTGALYAITNHEGDVERTSVLVTVDPADGAAEVVGTDLGLTDAEGLTFANDGKLWVTTGTRGGSTLFLVDAEEGSAEGVAVLGDGFGDFEAIACPNADA